MKRGPETQVYIAGPFSPTAAQKVATLTGIANPHRYYVTANILAAKRFGVEVAKLGVAPVIPHANTDHPDFETVQPYDFWIKATAEQLRRCDAIIMLPGWEQSSGAHGEHALAKRWGMPIFYSIAGLAEALS